ncbi:IS1595 family transposase [Candidatus Peregrinibacteria bacterium]|nr:MAG: IS1595 family transposase [Candidatus Peregrinibacteria bacterium]QQS59108.1 MAG: IS1595 family transposase [Candidatus Peregrinibacteria bacterium]QQS59231.1 MAG: IS1595 family transposase [Candidatus Peregrinibacteria bacterium]QQS59695.1 MAG: IS1595 family transposase [Candidatus Peregrinibacteria bacterium]QQS59787.1 MAG: IS1595 family transposase [Candidatus Peregrinibacteria bacterium]
MLKHAKISDYKIKKILMCFCEDIDASKTARILEINRRTIDRYFNIFREKITLHAIAQSKESGEFELDESYFGAKRVRGKRGRGAAGKTPVFGILKRDGKVSVTIVKKCSREELLPIIQGKILEGSTIHTDGWRAYDGLILNGYDHYRVYHSHDEFARGKCHVNGIESFWSFAKRRLSKFNGIASHKFNLHLKECEFRWNYKDQNLYDKMLKILKKF